MAQVTEQAVGRNVPQFLDTLAWCEGTSTASYTWDRGYDVVVMGHDLRPDRMVDYLYHPFEHDRTPKLIIPARDGHAATYSTASGRYQIELHTWLPIKQRLGLKDFSPASQDLACIELIRERRDAGDNALSYIRTGEIEHAISLVRNIWASLPGTAVVQGHGPRTMAEVLAHFAMLKGMS